MLPDNARSSKNTARGLPEECLKPHSGVVERPRFAPQPEVLPQHCSGECSSCEVRVAIGQDGHDLGRPRPDASRAFAPPGAGLPFGMDRLPSIMLGGAISKGPEASGRNGRAVPGGIVTHHYHPPAAVGTRSGRVGPSATAGSSVRMFDSGHVKTVGGTWSLSSGNEPEDQCATCVLAVGQG